MTYGVRAITGLTIQYRKGESTKISNCGADLHGCGLLVATSKVEWSGNATTVAVGPAQACFFAAIP
jgi:hypothetical protein